MQRPLRHAEETAWPWGPQAQPWPLRARAGGSVVRPYPWQQTRASCQTLSLRGGKDNVIIYYQQLAGMTVAQLAAGC